jgi:hypothetical protein
MTKKDPTPKRQESGRNFVVLYEAAGQEIRATATKGQLLLETWRREELMAFPDAEDVLVKITRVVAGPLDGGPEGGR